MNDKNKQQQQTFIEIQIKWLRLFIYSHLLQKIMRQRIVLKANILAVQ